MRLGTLLLAVLAPLVAANPHLSVAGANDLVVTSRFDHTSETEYLDIVSRNNSSSSGSSISSLIRHALALAPAEETVIERPHPVKPLWELSLFRNEGCEHQPNITITSKEARSMCLLYDDTRFHGLHSGSFIAHTGGKDCKWGCDRCKADVFFSGPAESTDCPEENLADRDWTKPDYGKCFKVRANPVFRPQYRIKCDLPAPT